MYVYLSSLLPLAAALAGAPPPPPAGCYTANVSQWPWCSGYARAGYACAGAFCSIDACVASCANCAHFYPGAALDRATARCCASLGPGGACNDPLPGDAPYNPPYGFPNNGPGALIVEGPIPYPNGPPCWSNATQLGAYGFTALVQSGATDRACPAPAPAGGGAWAPPPGLHPIALRAHGEPIDACMLACNWTEVARTGVDPCAAASIPDGGAVDPSLAGVRANYSCYFGGSSWLHPQGLGVCGFNCSVKQSDGAPCSEEDIEQERCLVYCDSRALPGPANPNDSDTDADVGMNGGWTYAESSGAHSVRLLSLCGGGRRTSKARRKMQRQ